MTHNFILTLVFNALFYVPVRKDFNLKHLSRWRNELLKNELAEQAAAAAQAAAQAIVATVDAVTEQLQAPVLALIITNAPTATATEPPASAENSTASSSTAPYVVAAPTTIATIAPTTATAATTDSDLVIVRDIINSAMPHGSVHLDADEDTDALERVNVISLRAASGARVPFVFTFGDQNICDHGCWCAGYEFYSVRALLPQEGTTTAREVTLLKCGAPTGNAAEVHADHAQHVSTADPAACNDVCGALGITAANLGVVLRALMMLDGTPHYWAFSGDFEDDDGGGGADDILHSFPLRADGSSLCRGQNQDGNSNLGVRSVAQSPRHLLAPALCELASRITPGMNEQCIFALFLYYVSF